MSEVFSLFAKLRMDSSEFERGIDQSEQSGKGLQEKLEGVFSKIQTAAKAAISVAAIKKGIDVVTDLANATAQAGDKIDKQSQALGMSRKAYQEWDYVLSQSGASIDNMGVSMKTLNAGITGNSKETREALSKLHLSMTELGHVDQETAFRRVVEAFQKLPSGAQKSALAVQLFGRNGQELLPLLNSSTESIDALREKAGDLGLIMGDDAVDAAVAYGDALDTLKRTAQGFKYTLGAQILPALTTGMTKITDYAGKLRKAYEKDGFSGIVKTITDDIAGAIKWPTWEDVKAAAVAGWETIKTGVAGLGGLIFGKNEEGKVNWPRNFNEAVEWARVNIWDGIVVKAAESFGGIVFGRDEEGKVNWPSVDKVRESAQKFWHGADGNGGVVGALRNIFVAPFDVENPGIGAQIEAISNWWNNEVTPRLDPVLDYTLAFFGLPDHKEMANRINEWVADVVDDIKLSPLRLIDSILGTNIAEETEQQQKTRAALIERDSETGRTWAEDHQIRVKAAEDGKKQAEEFAAAYQEYLDSLPPMTVPMTYDEFEAQKIEEKIKELEGPHTITFNFSTVPGGLNTSPTFQPVLKPRAIGEWNVPYDNFPALLHKNETVLTATQARQYRENGGGNGGGADMGALAETIVAAIAEAFQGVSFELNGDKITRSVSRGMTANVLSRRFMPT